MLTAPFVPETVRLQALERYAILDTFPEPAFERLVRLAVDLLNAPMAMVSFVEGRRTWAKARLRFPWPAVPVEHSFCAYAIQSSEVFVVPDARRDPRFSESPLVTAAPAVRFYAGAPLVTLDRHCLGTLCVLDTAPRPGISESERTHLEDLAAILMDELELRLASRQLAALPSTRPVPAEPRHDVEHRREPRLQTDEIVQVTVIGHRQKCVTASVLNFSGAGMRLELDVPLPVTAGVLIEYGEAAQLGRVLYSHHSEGRHQVGLQLEQPLTGKGVAWSLWERTQGAAGA